MSPKSLIIREDILGANREQAEANRAMLDKRSVRMINIMSSSGSGKTSLIIRTVERFRGKYRIAVIEGNVGASIDAEKIMRQNIPVIQINTAGGCHLDAPMTKNALDTLDLDRIDLILIENISNLVCTADFDLGAHRNVVVVSIPEGDDKPYKYPVMFVEADVVLVNKTDVLPSFDFQLDSFSQVVNGMNAAARVFPVSVKTGDGMERWFSWIEETLR